MLKSQLQTTNFSKNFLYELPDEMLETILSKAHKMNMEKVKEEMMKEKFATINIKGHRKVVVANYSAQSVFKLPDGIDLANKSHVKCWGVKWDKLYITYADGTNEMIYPTWEAEMDYKYAHEEIEDEYELGCGANFYESDDED